MTQAKEASSSVRDMTYLSAEKKVAFQAFILKRFGISIDPGDEVFPLLYLTYQHLMESTVRDKKITDELTTFQQLFKRQSVQQYHFTSTQAAFGYSFGKIGFPIVFALSLLFVGFLLFQSNQQAHLRRQHLQHWVDNAAIQSISYDGLMVPSVELTQVQSIDQVQAGKHYLLDSACQCVRVPLYFPPNNK